MKAEREAAAQDALMAVDGAIQSAQGRSIPEALERLLGAAEILEAAFRARELAAMKRLMAHAGFQFEVDRCAWVLHVDLPGENVVIPHAELGQLLDSDEP